MVKRRKRETDGKFAHEGDWDRLCTCGHTLGAHSCGSPADCLFYSLSENQGKPGAECGCTKFKLSKKKQNTRADFRRELNEENFKHRNGPYHNKTRQYGTYLYHQDRDKFEVDYQEWLEKKKANAQNNVQA